MQERLKKECKGQLGMLNPNKALNFLNVLQKEDCPEAYEPEIAIIQKQKQEEKRRQEMIVSEIDKTLFDFDEEIDNLSNVSERYQALNA